VEKAERIGEQTPGISGKFKAFPIKVRVNVIKTAKNLLKIQQKTAAIIAAGPVPHENDFQEIAKEGI
jgi:hypothetical protein